MRTLLTAVALFFVVVMFGEAAFAKPFDPVEPPTPPGVNYQHERTVPPSFGELNSPCYVRWTEGCA